MLDPSLLQLWADVEGWLRNARARLAVPRDGADEALFQFEHYLSHNEFELALDALFEAAERCQQNRHFWDCMCQAAAHMKLDAKHQTYAAKWSLIARPSQSEESSNGG